MLVTVPLVALSMVACAPAIFLGATTAGGVVAVDNRTVGAVIEDSGIEIKATLRLGEVIGDRARYSVVSINRVVLVVGQASDQQTKEEIEQIIAAQENVRKVINQVEIGEQIELSRRTADTFMTTKVKAELLKINASDFTSLDVKVVTENQVVYLMGLITVDNAALAIDAARKISGVRHVIQAFEYIEEDPDTVRIN